MTIDRIAPRLEQLGGQVKSLGPPWRAELHRNGSFRLLFGEGKVSYWPSARRPTRPFLDMGQTSDTDRMSAFATLRPKHKNKRGIPLEVTDFDTFVEWAFSEAPKRSLAPFNRDHPRAIGNPVVKVWE